MMAFNSLSHKAPTTSINNLTTHFTFRAVVLNCRKTGNCNSYIHQKLVMITPKSFVLPATKENVIRATG
jgi:hypothetical protein